MSIRIPKRSFDKALEQFTFWCDASSSWGPVFAGQMTSIAAKKSVIRSEATTHYLQLDHHQIEWISGWKF